MWARRLEGKKPWRRRVGVFHAWVTASDGRMQTLCNRNMKARCADVYSETGNPLGGYHTCERCAAALKRRGKDEDA